MLKKSPWFALRVHLLAVQLVLRGQGMGSSQPSATFYPGRAMMGDSRMMAGMDMLLLVEGRNGALDL